MKYFYLHRDPDSMSKILANAALPFALFSSGILLMGCEQAVEAPTEQAETRSSDLDTASQPQTGATAPTELRSGNMLYVVQLKQTQAEQQSAVEATASQQLQSTATQLQQQLYSFNQVLGNLNCESQEVPQIRSNIMSANQQVLASPLLNGDMDFSQIDLKKIESQMVNVQAEMIKLAGLLIQNPEQKSDSTTEQENT